MAQHPPPAEETSKLAPAAARIDAAALARWCRHIDHEDRPAPWLHAEVARRMAERLPLIRQQPQLVLDWWAPAGGSEAALKQQCPAARRIGVDSRGEAVTPAARATPWWRRLGSERSPVQTAAPMRADLLWANMMLHWVEDLPALLARWHAATAVDGFLMFSCLGPDTLRELHTLYRGAGLGPAGSPMLDMHDIGDALVHAGFADPVMDMEQLTLTWSDAGALLAELRSLGRNTDPQRHAGLRTPRWRTALIERIEAGLRRPDGRLHLTFEIIYGHAFRAAPKAPVAAQTEISLDAMREMTRRRKADSP